jgi:hypothetical protein
MPKISVATIKRSITKNGSYTPTAHAFVFKNTGNCTVFIDNDPLLPGEWFGDDSSHLVGVQATNPAIKFERNKAYEIKFVQHTRSDYAENYAESSTDTKRKTLFLIETIYKIEP